MSYLDDRKNLSILRVWIAESDKGLGECTLQMEIAAMNIALGSEDIGNLDVDASWGKPFLPPFLP